MDDSAVDKKLKAILATWLTHCKTIQPSRPCGAGVCAEYALQKLLKVDNALKSSEIRQGANLLMNIAKENLSPGGYKASSSQGHKEVLELGLSTFSKADALDRSGRYDSLTRKMYYNAWEFLGVVQDCDDVKTPDVEEKLKYAMWRATEIWKAHKEHREPIPPPTHDFKLSDEYGDLEGELDKLLRIDSPRTHRPVRKYQVGEPVLYSEDARAHRKVRATVMRIGWNDREQIPEYDIVLDDDNGFVRGVKNEFLAPCIDVGDCVLVSGEEPARVEDVFYSTWPPKYLVYKESGGLEEVHDIDLCTSEQKPVEFVESGSDVSVASGERSISSNREMKMDSEESHEFLASKQDPGDTLAPRGKGPDVSPLVAKVSAAPQADMESLARAEKSTKSALSALHFGDVPTAIHFLLDALQILK
jgi:hypothetical protein